MRTLWCVVLLLVALVGTASADRWLALWTEDDSWLGMKDNGEVWQLVPGGAPTYFGTFGTGSWVSFSKSWAYPHTLYALNSQGEIWAMVTGNATLYRTLPSGREWCSLLTVPEGGSGLGYFALACDGEIWTTAETPEFMGTLDQPPVPVVTTTWGQIKAGQR
jgi:hypothetical protein